MLSILQDLLVIFGVSLAVVLIFHRIKQPPIVGFIVSGIILGPSALGLIKSLETVKFLSELGLVFLLFTLGIEFNFKILKKQGRAFFGWGGLSSVALVLMLGIAAIAFGIPWQEGIFWGAVMSFSSTAVVLKLLQERREVASFHGNSTISILLFQDILVLPMMLLLPLLAVNKQIVGAPEFSFWVWSGKLVAVSIALYLASRWVLPKAFAAASRTGSREVLLMGAALFALGCAFLSHEIGLSLALGAFVAGLIISDSDFGLQAVSDLVPFRDLFVAIFFVSVGMLLDLRVLQEEWLFILAAAAGVFALKFMVFASFGSFLGFDSRIAALVALLLSQVGEFSFILAEQARSLSIISDERFQIFLAISVILLLATPLVAKAAPHLAPSLAELNVLKRVRRLSRGLMKQAQTSEGSAHGSLAMMQDHVVIVGFGLNGQSLARVLRATDIKYMVIEINADAAKAHAQGGEPVIFGDASRPEVLERAGIMGARMLVSAVSDANALTAIVAQAHKLRPDLPVLARCQYLREAELLRGLSDSDLVVAEIETVAEVFSRVLKVYGMDADRIEEFARDIQLESYGRLAQGLGQGKRHSRVGPWLPHLPLRTLKIEAGSAAEGKTLEMLHVRKNTGATVLALFRQGQGFQVVRPDTRLAAEDVVYLLAMDQEFAAARIFFQSEPSAMAGG